MIVFLGGSVALHLNAFNGFAKQLLFVRQLADALILIPLEEQCLTVISILEMRKQEVVDPQTVTLPPPRWLRYIYTVINDSLHLAGGSDHSAASGTVSVTDIRRVLGLKRRHKSTK